MFNLGELIIYGTEGVCRVEAIGAPQVSGAEKDRLYYTLEPLARSGRIFTPVDGKVSLRPVVSRERAMELVCYFRQCEAEAPNIRNVRELTEKYQQAITSTKYEDIVHLIRCIHKKREVAAQTGKKLGQIDERYLKRAEDLFYGELSVVLDIPRCDVCAYLMSEA